MPYSTPTFAPGRPADHRALRPARHLRNLLTQEQTDLAVHRERCRSDRSGQPFSLVLFRIPRTIGPTRTALRLARQVLVRSRGTDEVGWFDGETVCAILPDTEAAGAGRFADQVVLSLRTPSAKGETPIPPPVVAIYTYPTEWFVDGLEDGHPGRTLPQHIHHLDPAARPEPNDDGDDCDPPAPPPPAARPLSRLLARKLPWWKRLMDVVGAGTGLVVLSPAILATAAAIKYSSPGPVFFRQRRAGLGGRPFTIVKFRTMVVDAEAKKQALRVRSEQDGPAFKLADDPRVTGIGRLLRKTSLDELPQLWNVLRGDMSLVGPRPLPLDEQGGAAAWQHARLEVTPGLTCVWQVKGRSRVRFDEWVRMDYEYLRNRTFWHDVKILAQTVPAVLLRRGAR